MKYEKIAHQPEGAFEIRRGIISYDENSNGMIT